MQFFSSVDLSNFDTKNVRSMSYMFSGCSSLISLQFIKFNNNITDMGSMFSDCLVINSSNFVTNNVNDMSYMFFNCSSLTSLNLSNFKSNNNTNLSSMFTGINKSCKIICNDKRIQKQNF